MSEYSRVIERFEYHLEDLDCLVCLYYKPKSKGGCQSEICRFDDIRHEAISNGRIKRKRGHFSMRHYQKPQEEDYES